MQSIQNSFSTRDFPLQKIQNCLKFVPLDLRLQLGGNFHDRVLHFLVATNITPKQFFFEFSYFWDYLNPGLLCFFVERYGSSEDKELMKTYKQELKAFRICTPVGEFVKVAGADITINRGFYKKIIMKMDPEWENKTLEDAEEFKIDFCNENSFPQSITTRMDAVNSCVAIVFYVPIKVEISLEKLKPLLRRKKVVKVYMDNVCMVDWSEQVFGTSMFPEREEYMSFINTIISIRGGGDQQAVTAVKHVTMPAIICQTSHYVTVHCMSFAVCNLIASKPPVYTRIVTVLVSLMM